MNISHSSSTSSNSTNTFTTSTNNSPLSGGICTGALQVFRQNGSLLADHSTTTSSSSARRSASSSSFPRSSFSATVIFHKGLQGNYDQVFSFLTNRERVTASTANWTWYAATAKSRTLSFSATISFTPRVNAHRVLRGFYGHFISFLTPQERAIASTVNSRWQAADRTLPYYTASRLRNFINNISRQLTRMGDSTQAIVIQLNQLSSTLNILGTTLDLDTSIEDARHQFVGLLAQIPNALFYRLDLSYGPPSLRNLEMYRMYYALIHSEETQPDHRINDALRVGEHKLAFKMYQRLFFDSNPISQVYRLSASTFIIQHYFNFITLNFNNIPFIQNLIRDFTAGLRLEQKRLLRAHFVDQLMERAVDNRWLEIKRGRPEPMTIDPVLNRLWDALTRDMTVREKDDFAIRLKNTGCAGIPAVALFYIKKISDQTLKNRYLDNLLLSMTRFLPYLKTFIEENISSTTNPSSSSSSSTSSSSSSCTTDDQRNRVLAALVNDMSVRNGNHDSLGDFNVFTCELFSFMTPGRVRDNLVLAIFNRDSSTNMFSLMNRNIS